VFETLAFSRAVERGTRTRTGQPGPAYWRQYARYEIDASLDPRAKRLTGRESVTYVNHSPDTLRRIAVYLDQNIYAPGVVRNTPLPITGGVTLERVTVGSRALAPTESDSTPGYLVDGTVMWITLPKALSPQGDSVHLSFAWHFTVPPAPADGREGQDGDVFFLGYWYPRLAVYDDVSGWVTDPYMGRAEFYMGYGDYDVRLTVPAGWLVGATGTLENPTAVLSPTTRARLADARRRCTVVHVVPANGRGAGRATASAKSAAGTLTWRFAARDVRDFAWATSASYLWDATCALTRDSAPADTVDIYSFFRPTPEASAWTRGAAYNRNAIEFLSRYLWPYPYPQMTAVEGILTGGGMEYPMLTVIQSYRDTMRLAGNLMHEDGHMWFPMQVGSNERRHTWQDEGLTQFNSGQGTRTYYDTDREGPARAAYLALVREGREAPLMRWGDLYPDGEVYSTQSYMKTTTVLVALRAVLGDSLFLKAYREYGRRWVGKHPTPYDFFNTFDDVSGRDLSWFWRTWFFETWTLDQAIASVRSEGDSATITIEDRGLAPMPVLLEITRADGSAERMTVPVDVWLAGARRTAVRVRATPAITRVVIDPEERFPDIDRANQRWTP
jgi:hypothetical protein